MEMGKKERNAYGKQPQAADLLLADRDCCDGTDQFVCTTVF